MKYLKISNDGILDENLIHLMGGTTKDQDSSKIGQFGTGLKYCLSYVIRNNLDFKIFLEYKEVKITTQTVKARGEDFNVIYLDGQRTSITDKMGTSWKGWMIVREIWCNALDEQNPNVEVVEEIIPEDNKTCFFIQLAGEILDTWNNWDKYFIDQSKSIAKIKTVDKECVLYNGGDKTRLYKNGVLIKEVDKPSVFAYDLPYASLNELREYSGYTPYDIVPVIYNLPERLIEVLIRTMKPGYYEWDTEYPSFISDDPSDDWGNLLDGKEVATQEIKEMMMSIYPETMRERDVIIFPDGLYRNIVTKFPRVSLASMDSGNPYIITTDKNQELLERIHSCIKKLNDCRYYIDSDLIIETARFKRDVTEALLLSDEKKIVLSEKLVIESDMYIMRALVHENEHYVSKHADERSFTSHFIDLYIQELMRNERHSK